MFWCGENNIISYFIAIYFHYYILYLSKCRGTTGSYYSSPSNIHIYNYIYVYTEVVSSECYKQQRSLTPTVRCSNIYIYIYICIIFVYIYNIYVYKFIHVSFDKGWLLFFGNFLYFLAVTLFLSPKTIKYRPIDTCRQYSSFIQWNVYE